MSPVAVAQSRWGLLCVLLFAALRMPWFVRLTRPIWPDRRDTILAIMYGACFLGPAHLLYYTSLEHSSTVVGTVLNTTAPLWVAVFSLFILNERLTPARTAAIVLGISGAYMVSVGFHFPDFSGEDTTSNMRYLTATLLECLGGVLAIRLVRRNSGITILAFQVVGALLVFVLAPVILPRQLPVLWTSGFSMPATASIVYMVFIPGLLCWGAWYVVAERAPINKMVVSTLVQPIAAAFIAFYLTHEPITTPILVGSAVIISALLVAARTISLREQVPSAKPDEGNHGQAGGESMRVEDRLI